MKHVPWASMARPAVTLVGFVAVWYLGTRLTGIEPYLLPNPQSVAVTLWSKRDLLMESALTTFSEILLGLLAGTALGSICALAMVFSPMLERWLMPVLLLSQAIPVFALAPLLVLWFGFGISSKVIMATIIIFFPVAAAFADGLRHTERGWLDLAHTMNASPTAILRFVRLPAALPAFASGLRVAAAIAPIGAVIGEWVGASSGLGYVMLSSNARIQTDETFAALVVLAVIAILLWMVVDRGLKWLLYWAPDTTAGP